MSPEPGTALGATTTFDTPRSGATIRHPGAGARTEPCVRRWPSCWQLSWGWARIHTGADGGDRYTTAVGGFASVPMTDGSKVTLNTDSVIRVALTEHERRVELERGEAFFEVAKDQRVRLSYGPGRSE